MLRLVSGILVGILAWVVIAILLNLGLRHGWHDYAAVEKVMTFTAAMMAARLSISAIGSLASGAVAARIDRSSRAPLFAGMILLLLFLPVHYSLWSKFPLWYHLTFFASLPILSVIGGRLAGSRALKSI